MVWLGRRQAHDARAKVAQFCRAERTQCRIVGTARKRLRTSVESSHDASAVRTEAAWPRSSLLCAVAELNADRIPSALASALVPAALSFASARRGGLVASGTITRATSTESHESAGFRARCAGAAAAAGAGAPPALGLALARVGVGGSGRSGEGEWAGEGRLGLTGDAVLSVGNCI
jgi:hypothetical protein